METFGQIHHGITHEKAFNVWGFLLLSGINFECAVRIYNPFQVSSIHCTRSNFRESTRIVSKIDTVHYHGMQW